MLRTSSWSADSSVSVGGRCIPLIRDDMSRDSPPASCSRSPMPSMPPDSPADIVPATLGGLGLDERPEPHSLVAWWVHLGAATTRARVIRHTMLRSTAARLVTPTPTRSAHAISIHRLRAATPHPASTTRFVHSISPTRNRASTAQTASTSSDNDSSSDAFAGSDRRPVILFDGVCNMCNGGVNFVLDWDPAGKVRFCALQSDAGRKLLQRCNRR